MRTNLKTSDLQKDVLDAFLAKLGGSELDLKLQG